MQFGVGPCDGKSPLVRLWGERRASEVVYIPSTRLLIIASFFFSSPVLITSTTLSKILT